MFKIFPFLFVVFVASSISHEITFHINPIYMLEVKEDFTYGITVLGENPAIVVTLLTNVDDVEVLMHSTIGESLGWVKLIYNETTPLVLNVKGNEFNNWEMRAAEKVYLSFEIVEQ